MISKSENNVVFKLCLTIAVCSASACNDGSSLVGENSERVKKSFGILLTSDTIIHQLFASVAVGQRYTQLTSGRSTFTFPQESRIVALIQPDSGTLYYNTSAVPKNGDGLTYQSFSIPVVCNGSAISWSTSGYTPLASWAPSLQTPSTQVYITAPANASDHSKSASLSISWNAGSGSPAQSVLIEITRSEGGSWSSAGAIVDQNSDTGSRTFSASELIVLSPGKHVILVRRGYFITGTAPDSKKFIVAHFVESSIEINITS